MANMNVVVLRCHNYLCELVIQGNDRQVLLTDAQHESSSSVLNYQMFKLGLLPLQITTHIIQLLLVFRLHKGAYYHLKLLVLSSPQLL